ncbi:MAG: 50S ribosomal protein L25 [Candidatus Omnitrophota bacterium]|jgi:large subunit ribosomal protein L25
MEQIILEVESREESGRVKAKILRDSGFIPAIVYGEGKKSQSVKVANRALLQLLHEHGLENVVINLSLKDDKKQKNRSCLIKEIQYDPVRGNIIHVDFNEISLTKALKVNVPVAAKGEPVGVKQDGGSLEHVLWEIEVECLPTDIPKEIEVDVGALKIGDAIHIKDITFPANIKVLNALDAVVISVAAPVKVEEVTAEAEAGAATEPEVIKEKKEVPEAEGAAPKEEKKEKKEEKK